MQNAECKNANEKHITMRKRVPKWIGITVAVAVALVFCAPAWWEGVQSMFSSRYVENVKISNDWIYFTSGYSFNRGNPLYRMKTDGTKLGGIWGRTKLARDKIDYFDVTDDWVFYTSNDDNRHLYRMRLDGKERERLTDYEALVLKAVDGWVYCLCGDTDDRIGYYFGAPVGSFLYRIKMDGTSREKLLDSWLHRVDVVDGWIYFSTGSENGDLLYRMKTDGTNREKLSNDNIQLRGCPLIVADGWIYYNIESDDYDKTPFVRIKTDGTEREELLVGRIESPTVIDDWIYYSTGREYCRMKTDGTEQQQMFEEYGKIIDIVDGWMYYQSKAARNSNILSDICRIRLDGTDKQKLY